MKKLADRIVKMNAEKISMLLAATVSPDRELAPQAEKELDSMQKVSHFLVFAN